MSNYDYATKIDDDRPGWRITKTGGRAHWAFSRARSACGVRIEESWHADSYWMRCKKCRHYCNFHSIPC